MNHLPLKRLGYVIAGALLLANFAFAHETQVVTADGTDYKIIVGFSKEPAFTEERNGLDLFVRLAEDDSPVANLENGLRATLVAPDGESTRTLTIRAVHGQEGVYTDDFVLTATGPYQLRLQGFIGSTEIDLLFHLHDVGAFDSLRFP